MAFVAAALSSEFLVPAAAAGVGVVAAAAFVASGATEGGPGDAFDAPDEPEADAAALAEAEAEEERLMQPPRLTPEKEKELRQRMSRMSPESKKALEDWANLPESDKFAMAMLNLMIVILFVGAVVGAFAYLLAAHEVNVLQFRSWDDLSNGFNKVLKDFTRPMAVHRGFQHDPHPSSLPHAAASDEL
eukprot:TRINITY_DN7232_c1_g3_i1.p1 TRINITY_DN7232_c1_g3~~TRINITY_DN7232_c1_g3_i1.p1  ORF type:complete len:210 (-),score=64.96 TRINITY_DN7232_c1_g3_i1:405-968(-)